MKKSSVTHLVAGAAHVPLGSESRRARAWDRVDAWKRRNRRCAGSCPFRAARLGPPCCKSSLPETRRSECGLTPASRRRRFVAPTASGCHIIAGRSCRSAVGFGEHDFAMQLLERPASDTKRLAERVEQFGMEGRCPGAKLLACAQCRSQVLLQTRFTITRAR